MGDDYTLLTPENVELRYDVAGLGSRVAAAVIDYCIISVGYVALLLGGAFLFGALAAISSGNAGFVDSRLFGYVVVALAVLLAFFGWWGYFVLFEVLWNGQSIGKRQLGLRVVRRGGQPISLTASIVRNLLRIIDGFLTLGILVMILDRRGRRLGDLAAGTLVVREPRLARAFSLSASFAPVLLPGVSEERVEAVPNADRLTMAHYALIRDYFARRSSLPASRASALAAQIAGKLARTLEVAPADIGDPAHFLATLAHAFEARNARSE